eukprot:3840539-Prymnesium_polylepis.1
MPRVAIWVRLEWLYSVRQAGKDYGQIKEQDKRLRSMKYAKIIDGFRSQLLMNYPPTEHEMPTCAKCPDSNSDEEGVCSSRHTVCVLVSDQNCSARPCLCTSPPTSVARSFASHGTFAGTICAT